MNELTANAKNLVMKFALWQKSLKPKEGVATIHVDEVASKIAAFYEHIRTIIDWKEEHLMRRAAIIRKLKRRFFDLELNNFATANVSENLVLELIRGGFFPNDTIEESRILDVQRIIDKYVFILKHSPKNDNGKAGLRFYNKLLEIASCEIEETLAPAAKEHALLDFMFAEMKTRIIVAESIYKKGLLEEKVKDILIYIAVQEALFKFDTPIISYNLLKYRYPNWAKLSEPELLAISENIHAALRQIENDINHPLAKKFYAICEKYDTPYLLLGDVLSKASPEKISQDVYDPAALESYIRQAYANRLSLLKEKIRRAAIYSTISIFISKILVLLVIEIILDRIFHGQLNVVSIVADILIPTTLMALLVFTAKTPSRKNLNLAVMETMNIVYRKEKQETYEVKGSRKRSTTTRTVLSLVYLAGACVSFGAIYWVFTFFQFSITSIIINFIFIALILFAGTAIKKRAQELTIEEESEGFLGFISDILFLPIMGVGRWLSNTWKQYNAITAFFNALIDMPFSSFIEFLERWRYFIKEKKEELR